MATKHWPLKEVIIRSGGSTGYVGSFGYTRNGGSKKHNGVDFVAYPDTPVYAAHDGVISRAGFQVDSLGESRNVGYGSRIWLDGDLGIQTRYAHLHGQIYEVGMEVKCGDQIGWTGYSGNCDKDAPHLHFEVLIRGEPVNPEWWFGLSCKKHGFLEGELNG